MNRVMKRMRRSEGDNEKLNSVEKSPRKVNRAAALTSALHLSESYDSILCLFYHHDLRATDDELQICVKQRQLVGIIYHEEEQKKEIERYRECTSYPTVTPLTLAR